MKQTSFQNTRFALSHGGTLRNKRRGRGFRPLSTKEPLHLVFKTNRIRLRSGLRSYKSFFLIHRILQQYAHKFFIKIEQVSVQGDHLHLLIRTTRRSNFQNFMRVFSGQIAQRFQSQGLLVTDTPAAGSGGAVTDTPQSDAHGAGLWKYRPFSRVVRGWRAYRTIRDYIQLNEKEALGEIPYRKMRLRGLLPREWEQLWG